MKMICTGNRTLLTVAAVALISNLAGTPAMAEGGQRPEVQRAFQSGAYDEAVQAAEGGDPASIYVAAQAMLKADRAAQAREQFARLRGSDNPGWQLIAQSGEALVGGDTGGAVTLARQATEAAGDNAFAFYQLGFAASRASDWGTASTAFARSVELKGDFAYAHYYGGIANQRARRLSKAAEHFDAFLRLAPDAPERQAVQAIMRTLK
jgi:tetratricopeptide (TPR) repeat protein